MTTYYNPDDNELRSLLVGKSVVSATVTEMMDTPGYYAQDVGTLVLSDGTVLRVGGNVGGCSCGAGDYDLTELNTVDNIITNVQVIEPAECDYGMRSGAYRVFVFADNAPINLATFEGDDGSGYYGTGFWVEVLDG